ncbi:ABC transporter permease [Rhodopila sp.]|uniref:ABC transporter permease n=1 Tax=Rhodopila sp. TaxID=2480087 RepID=UPI003D0A4252
MPRRTRIPVGLLAAGLTVAALVLLPLSYTINEALQVDRQDAIDLVFRPLVGELLLNTLSLVLATTLLSALLATAAAWCVERTDLPGRHVWGVLAAVPLAIPAFVSSFAWISLSLRLQDFAGAVVVVTCSYYPLVYLPVAAALRGMDPALEETARALGETGWGSFRRVVLPQLRPALLGGMLLVALDTLVEFGALSLLRFRTFTTEIYAEYRTGFDSSEIALLAMILLALCLVCLAAELWVRGRSRYARVGRGTRRASPPHRLGRARYPVLAGFALLVAATLGVPLGMIIYWLTQHGSAAITPEAVSAPALLSATLSSLQFGAAGAAASLLLAFPLAVLATQHDSRLVTLIERSAYLAQGTPGIVVALALVSLTVQRLQPLYQSAALLIIAYAILFLPLALVSTRAALAQLQRGLQDAGRSLGLGWMAVLWRVLLPLAGPGLGAAAAMVFVSVMTELTATLLLAPIGTRTLATQVWANTSSLAFAAASPYAALMTLISLLSAWLLARRFGATALSATR